MDITNFKRWAATGVALTALSLVGAPASFAAGGGGEPGVVEPPGLCQHGLPCATTPVAIAPVVTNPAPVTTSPSVSTPAPAVDLTGQVAPVTASPAPILQVAPVETPEVVETPAAPARHKAAVKRHTTSKHAKKHAKRHHRKTRHHSKRKAHRRK
jgi:hypothetical protein